MKTEYTISQIAEKLHITTNKIRFYEKKVGSTTASLHPVRNAGSHPSTTWPVIGGCIKS